MARAKSSTIAVSAGLPRDLVEVADRLQAVADGFRAQRQLRYRGEHGPSQVPLDAHANADQHVQPQRVENAERRIEQHHDQRQGYQRRTLCEGKTRS